MRDIFARGFIDRYFRASAVVLVELYGCFLGCSCDNHADKAFHSFDASQASDAKSGDETSKMTNRSADGNLSAIDGATVDSRSMDRALDGTSASDGNTDRDGEREDSTVNADNGGWLNITSGRPIYAIADSPEEVWFGTEGGLVRYQKRSAKWFYYDHTNSELPCNRVLSLALDADNRVWVGTRHNGVARFDGNVWFVPDFPTPQGAVYTPEISSLYVAQDETLWAGTDDGYVHGFDGSKWTTYYVVSPIAAAAAVKGLVIDSKGRFWVATPDGLGTLNTSTGAWVRDETFPVAGQINGLTLDSEGVLWVAYPKGVSRLDGDTWVQYTAANAAIFSQDVYMISEDSEGGIWVSGVNGVANLVGADWSIYSLPEMASQSEYPFSVCFSGDGTLWVGTSERLLSMCDGIWKTERSSQYELPANNINALLESADGAVWVGTSRGLARWDAGQWSTFDMSNSALPHNQIYALALERDGKTIWIGTRNGLARYDGSAWQIYNSTNSVLPSDQILSLLVDAAERLWVGTTAGLAERDGDKWRVYKDDNSALPSNTVSGLAVDSKDDLWIALAAEIDNTTGSYVGGLAKYDGSSFQIFTPDNSGLPTVHVSSVAVDEKDIVWAATVSPVGPPDEINGGLARWDGSSWKVYKSQTSLLPHNYVMVVKPDMKGKVWVGTVEGLASFDGSQWEVWHHRTSGLSEEDIFDILVDSRGNAWIGTGFEGLSIYREGGVDLGIR